MAKYPDLFLLGTVLYIIPIGLYMLFVDHQLPLTPWLSIHDLDDLKNKLTGVVILVMGVLFLGQVVTWDGERDLLRYSGAMLATSRTVSRGKMSAFEFLRIVERDGGLVYVAQPNGSPPTDFMLTELTKTRAVFDNPRLDYPQRIVYEQVADGRLIATVGYMKGGTPRRFEFNREGN